jgi:hypothetical protein
VVRFDFGGRYYALGLAALKPSAPAEFDAYAAQ